MFPILLSSMVTGESPPPPSKGKQSDTEALCQPPPPILCGFKMLSIQWGIPK